MLKALIIDDVDFIRLEIRNQLKAFANDVSVVGEAYSVATALGQIGKHQPDVLFLDIDLGDGTGFDVLKKINYTHYKIIFITSFDNYAIKAFKFNAIDYILKPFDEEDLAYAIEKLKLQVAKDEIELKYNSLLSSINSIDKKPTHIILKNATTMYNVAIHDIIYCQAESNYTKIYLSSGKSILMSKPLKEYDELFSEHSFFRIHQSYLINMAYVDAIKSKNEMYVVLTNDTQLPLSHRKRHTFKDELMKKRI